MSDYKREPRYCLQCDDGTVLTQETKDITIFKKGLTLIVPAVKGWHCPNCGEIEFQDDSGERYAKAMDELYAKVRARDGEEIKACRKRLGLTQKEAAALFGGGSSAFSEYELGKTQPHRSAVLLLKLLYNHPDLLEEVVTAATTL